MEEHDRNIHGGNVYEVAKQYGIAEKELIDFSASINPLGMSGLLKELLAESLNDLVNYPDPECNELRREVSQYLGVPKESVITGNGASEIICLLFEVLKPLRVFMPAPCFSEYECAARSFDAQIAYYKLLEEEEFRLDVDSFTREIPDKTDTILICNPNNPTSRLIPGSELLKLIAHAYERNISIIVDEAFIELTLGGNENSIAGWLGHYPNLFIIRSLTKILAVPGLRVGYALGEHSVIQRMWLKKIKWSVNSLACHVGRVLNEDTAYFKATSDWLSKEMDRFYKELTGIGGLKVFKPETNFILMKILDERYTSISLRELLIRQGFLIRDASNFKFLDDKYIRLAIKDKDTNDLLTAALSKLLHIPT